MSHSNNQKIKNDAALTDELLQQGREHAIAPSLNYGGKTFLPQVMKKIIEGIKKEFSDGPH